VKKGSYTGQMAEVIDPAWNGMVKVVLEGMTKRYLYPSEIERVEGADGAKNVRGRSRSGSSDGRRRPTVQGSVLWAAPELFQGERISMASDVYGFGVVLWELATSRLPYDELAGPSPHEIASMVTFESLRPHTDTSWPDGNFSSRAEVMPPQYVALMQACWHPVPSCRPSMSQCLHQLRVIVDQRRAQVRHTITYHRWDIPLPIIHHPLIIHPPSTHYPPTHHLPIIYPSSIHHPPTHHLPIIYIPITHLPIIHPPIIHPPIIYLPIIHPPGSRFSFMPASAPHSA
jgi:hypothetical protein